MPRVLSLVLLFVATGAVQAQGEPLVKKVKTSITKGVGYLVSQQKKDGGWEQITHYEGGATALALLALLNSEGPFGDAKLETRRTDSIEAGLANLRKIESPKVYVRALQTMALAEARRPGDAKLIRSNVEWLLEARVFKAEKFIGWEYENRKGASRDSDASNSQYAMLALWYARQYGVKIDRKVWEEIRDYYTRTQNKDGSWIYSIDYGPDDDKGPSVTMTVAGLCGLLISGMELNGDREEWLKNGAFKNCGDYSENAPATKAMQWLTRKNNFSINLDRRAYYHLYGLERAGRLSGQRFFGEHDWYREGCEFLTQKQEASGAWIKPADGWDRWPVINTSFALLFLSKGRTPVLISKLVHGNWPRREDDTDWNNDRNDLLHLTEHISRGEMFQRKPVAWQTYDVMRALYARSAEPKKEDEDAIVADMLQSPILYFNGHQSPLRRIQDRENNLIKRFVESNGFLFAEACCGSAAFDKGIKEWVEEHWPGHKLEYLTSTHPVWTSFHTVQPGEYKLMGLQVGCRTIMIYSPQDLSCYWESNRDDGRTQLAYRLGENIVAFATGRTPPQPRLTPIELATLEKPLPPSSKRGLFQVGQILHSTDWQLAPKAMSNLLEHVHKTAGLDVLLKTEQVRLVEPSTLQGLKFLYMHGRDAFNVKNDDLPALRFTLDYGGLLFADACCGNEVFDASFRKFVHALYPKEKLVRVPADDRLYSAALNNKVALNAKNIRCRITANGDMQPMEPYLEGIKVKGRWVVLYSKYDIGCALERNTSAYCMGYDSPSALKIAMAAVLYTVRP